MIKYSVVDMGDETVRSEVQIEGNVKLLIVEFGQIAGHLYKAFKSGTNASMAKGLLVTAVETGIKEAEKEQE
ncbi:hypothetical protein [Dorea ammoniilytica]|uniref:Uncharacterized protein n=1 Tax=Dorea ammoniilytica TaxID=2981788 RepID=A0ABT2S842_9FIRM|nr:hypothetical protein [Dorea ammoniilytica]MCU6700688.1 hypothetical protein [Dorea ammoniilytica]SCH99170.1 Uncharacterised protein [uncultured Eubacterium sp.]